MAFLPSHTQCVFNGQRQECRRIKRILDGHPILFGKYLLLCANDLVIPSKAGNLYVCYCVSRALFAGGTC